MYFTQRLFLFVALLLAMLPQIAIADLFSCSSDVIYCPANPPSIDYSSYGSGTSSSSGTSTSSGTGSSTYGSSGQSSTYYPYTKLMYCYGSKRTGALTSCSSSVQTLPTVYSRYSVYQVAYMQMGLPWKSGMDLYSTLGMYGDLYANSSMWIVPLFAPGKQNVQMIVVVSFS